MRLLLSRFRFLAVAAVSLWLSGSPSGLSAAEPKTLNVLFIGNSFTGRHTLSQVVKSMAEAADPNLRFQVTTVIYGGRTLKDHWRLRTQNIVRLAALTAAEETETLAALAAMLAKDPKDNYARSAIRRHEELLPLLAQPRAKWDVVVLQSYRDDTQGDASSYLEYAPKFAELIQAQGGRVVLYETTPDTQNVAALSAAPDPAPIMAKARMIAALAKRIDAAVVPMSTVALHCQTVRPDLTLRFVNDGHLNHTMAYLTACTFQAALFGRSAEGSPIDAITDIRFLDEKHKNLDRDGKPIRRQFTSQERADLQRIAWEGYREFEALAAATEGGKSGKLRAQKK